MAIGDIDNDDHQNKETKQEVTRRHNIRSIFQSFGLFLLLVISFWIFGKSLATGPATDISSSATTCGQSVTGYTYKVPYGSAPWNQPACSLPLWRNSAAKAEEMGSNMYHYGQLWNAKTADFQATVPQQKGKFMTQFGLAGDASDYSIPIYYASQATTKKKIMICDAATCLPSNLDKDRCYDTDLAGPLTCLTPEREIPWNDAWRPAGDQNDNPGDNGNDNEMVIIDGTTVYELNRVDRTGLTCVGFRGLVYNARQKSPDKRLCVSQAIVLRDKNGAIANYLTYDEGTSIVRGMGIQDSAMVVTPEEVQEGEIRHALTMESVNTMFGPDCTATQLAAGGADVGTTCGYAVAPATRNEWKDARDITRNNYCKSMDEYADFNTKQTFKSLLTLSKTVPEGMRFRITSTDAEITNWINSRADLRDNPAKARTARIFAVALRDYGWIVGDTTCYGAGFNLAGVANKDAKEQWKQMGIDDASSQYLLQGLFKETTVNGVSKTNIVALDPPVNTCLDGKKTQYACVWTSSAYSTASAATPTPPPAASPTPAPAPAPAPAPTPPPAASPTPAPNTNNSGANIPTGGTSTTGTVAPPAVKAPTIFKASYEFGLNTKIWAFDRKIVLSWNAGSSPNGVAKYRLVAGSKELYSGTAKSFDHWSVAENTTYEYSLTTIDSKNFVSEPIKIKRKLIECFFGIACKLQNL